MTTEQSYYFLLGFIACTTIVFLVYSAIKVRGHIRRYIEKKNPSYNLFANHNDWKVGDVLNGRFGDQVLVIKITPINNRVNRYTVRRIK